MCVCVCVCVCVGVCVCVCRCVGVCVDMHGFHIFYFITYDEFAGVIRNNIDSKGRLRSC